VHRRGGRARHFARAGAGIFGVVDRFEFLDLPFRIVFQHDFDWPEDRHHARRALVQIFAQAMFEHGDVDGAIALGYADAFTEVTDRFRRIATPPDTGQRRHARIVPAVHMALIDELDEFALGEDDVGQVDARELDLLRQGTLQ